MNSAPSIASETLSQLESARALALSDAAYYNQIVPGVLPIIGAGANATLELRRWGADFLAETFASPTLGSEDKQRLSLQVLETLRENLETVDDTGVVKSVVQAAASIYPLVFRHILSSPNDVQNWQVMAAIKSNILRRMDSASPGVRICCIKFVQRVVQVETPGLIADPRRPEQNEISLALVPRDHPLIPPQNLEAEASGLLDRLLSILQDDTSDALLVTATLNSLGTLIRSRPSISNKIISTVLNFNPLKLANSPMTPKVKVMVKSMERTTRALLLNIIKKSPENPLNPRIHQYLERMNRMRQDAFDESNRKRPAPSEPTDGLDPAKRQRLGAEALSDPPSSIPPLPPGPTSSAQLFTLTRDEGAKNFDVQAIPSELVVKILVPMLMRIDKGQMDNAINAVRARYLSLSKSQPRSAADAADATTGKAPLDEEDEYEPDYQPTEDAEQIVNKLDNAPPEGLLPERVPDAPLAPFKLPQAPPLTEEQIEDYGGGTVRRVFGIMSALDDTTSRSKVPKPGFNRLAASNYDRDAWVTVISRLATRASTGLEAQNDTVKSEYKDVSRKGNFSISNTIREALFNYIMSDWKRRIDVASSWLSEEWYNDRIRLEAARAAAEGANGDSGDIPVPTLHYRKWILKLLDAILPYMDGKDKVMIRFLSEIPDVDRDVLDRVKKMARDPERVGLAIAVIHYLVLFRPPVRDICLDALEDLWRNYDGAKTGSAKILTKWRPEVLQQEATNGAHEDVKS
ncbi:uncharacterized protein K441DRAFT_656220 [Cenococcum geophilum 1.58]|uniref:uncharacterized protein n=1 Tax=Cenococcum geophilum 1.58 TaxID=794803 RepID=UPI00358E5D3C|nr:hypothetical protein K441DRAFT_656220 [Cenococcum geophilum 1.58]